MIAIRMMALGRKLGNLYAGLCAPICRQYGMNQTCFDVLMFCANNPDRNTARDVCEVRGIKSGMASVAVETLEKSGLLERREDPEDRRRKLVYILPKGQQCNETMYAVIQSGDKKLLEGFTPEEETQFREYLLRALHNVSPDFDIEKVKKEESRK